MTSANTSLSKRILFCVLDWGLGHAARSIPVIHLLLEKHCEVFIASSGDALKLLRAEFPDLQFFNLTPYAAIYSSTLPLMLKLSMQVPKFLKAIKSEQAEVSEIVAAHQIDFIISDNRYGCRSSSVPSIFITHQVHLRMPRMLNWLEPLLRGRIEKMIIQFDQCWIPDEAHKLTGDLTKPPPVNHCFVGTLSRFVRKENVKSSQYDLVAILSGPEPQRSIFESEIVKAMERDHLKGLVVRGVLEPKPSLKTQSPSITFVNYYNSKVLSSVLQEAKVVVCRSGYSSIMDLATLQKKNVVLVPTPGQTEQEYLAEILYEKNIAYYQRQGALNVQLMLSRINDFSGFVGWKNDSNLLANAINEMLK